MKRFATLIFVFFAVYFVFQIGFKFATGGYELTYEIKSDKNYVIKEISTLNKKNEHDNYYITISDGNNEFAYQIYSDLNKAERIVKDVKSYYDDRYRCIFPIFKNGYQLDVTCLSNGVQYYYQSIKGIDTGLDNFVSTLSEAGYLPIQDSASPNENSNVTFFKDNIVKNHFFAVENYRGLQLLNSSFASSLYTSTLFSKDIYNRNISAFVGKYYVVADYDADYEFNKFYLVDMETLKKSTVEYHKNISFDSYVQGVVDHSLYLFDRSSKKQYELNVKTKTMIEVGNVDLKIKYYQNGVWSTISAYDAANKNLYFVTGNVTNEFSGYERVDKVGGELSGYYYFYKKVGNGYDIYRANIQNPTKLTYLFKINSISNIVYLENYLYFRNGDTICYYSDETGIRKLYRNTEFNFNSNLNFGVSD